jgi:hypothetical protein
LTYGIIFRRLFVEILESGKVTANVVISQSNSNTKKNSNKSNLDKFYNWFSAQYEDFQKLLCSLISKSQYEWAHALSVRTLMELVKVDHHLYRSHPSEEIVQQKLIKEINFGIDTYRSLLHSLVYADVEIDIDLLLMIKEEVNLPDKESIYLLRVLTMISLPASRFSSITIASTSDC